jgi:PAS domain S-box-containing protein
MLTENSAAPLILVVEDNHSHVELIRRSLGEAQEEYRLEIAGSISAANNNTDRYLPALVLSDFKLPDGAGIELVIAANGAWPVVLMTSHGNEQLAVEAMKAGALDYIVKSPEKFTQISRVIQRALREWSLIVSNNLAVAALRESEEKHRKLANEQKIILKTSSVGICFLKDRRVLWANPAFDGMFGYELGMTHDMDTETFYLDKETYKSIGENAYSAIESGVIYSHDVVMKKRDGSLLWCNIVGQAVNPDNRDDGSIWIMLDITARKQAEEERLALEAQFQQTQKLESLGVLAGGIAHDFNNILAIILGHCFIIKENLDADMDRLAHVNMIENAAERAADLCRQMLSYAGKNALVQTCIDLRQMVNENVKMLKSAIKKNVSMELEVRGDVPEITGDNAQIQQIIMNLIINAAEAIGDKNGTIKITLGKIAVMAGQGDADFLGNAINPGCYTCLKVSDNGCGMGVETQKRIFEPFYTTKFTGRGLGMSAVLGIIKSHDGFLLLSSAPGIGTTFKIYFPSRSGADSGEAVPQAALAPVAKCHGTILLVDDEDALRSIGSTLLKKMGFATVSAANGLEALEIFREHDGRIDLVLLDLLMPEMGGVEVYRRLRELSAPLPVIICSGYSVEDVLQDIGNDPLVAVCQKPYKYEQLRDTLIKLLDAAE